MDSETLPVEAVIITSRLAKHASRLPDLLAENRAMLQLAEYLSHNPNEMLQKLAEIAVELCGAGSAGVSILEEHNEVFRWYAAAGEYANLRWETLPQFFSPCGTVVTSTTTQLMSYPERHFTYLADIDPKVVEVLLIPFCVNEKIVGTVWIVSHTPAHGFDSEDVRIISNLSAFAAAGFKTLQIQNGLEAAIRNRDEFLAILGHELRNPLFPLATAQSLLSTAQLPEVQRTAVDVIGRQLTHMQRLIDDILDASRIAEGKIAVVKRAVDVVSLVEATLDAIRPRFDKADLQLIAAVPPTPIYINADPDRIMQIIGNLLINAVKFTPAKGRVAVVISVIEQQVRVSVTDTGIGLAPENLNSIFTMFNQVEGLPVGKSGLGIGLSLAKTLAELHDGTITVHSDGIDKGCEFSIRLPILSVAETVVSEHEETNVESPAEAAALRILIVDDNQDAADSLGILLRTMGHEVQVIYSGKNTIERAATWIPHLIFHDINLPEVDGYTVIEQLRCNASTRHCVVVALTGYATEADRRRTRETGFDAHLVKPIDFDKLRWLLASIPIYEGIERRVVDAKFKGSERRRILVERSR